MTLIAAVLIIISAGIHAAWNLIGKRENPSPSFFLVANLIGCLCLAPVALTHLSVIGRFPAQTWVMLGITGICQAVYFTGLAGAYRTGHLSVTYPLARSAPVVMVAGINLLIGKIDQLSGQSIAGMMLITVGALVLPVERPKEWAMRDYLHVSSLFALMAALGTVGYSMVDDSALRLLRATAGMHAGRTTVTLIYAMFEGLSSSFWLSICLLLNRKERESFGHVVRRSVGRAAVAGVGIFAAYSLVLMAMAHVHNVSYVVAFRQLGIPLGAAFGVLVLREPRYSAKLVGIAIMMVGLILVATG
jgi:drug/metabolite transporter (DMT)-like permease